jgi:hypothetical protein
VKSTIELSIQARCHSLRMTYGLEIVVRRLLRHGRECPTRIHVNQGTLNRQFLSEEYVHSI